MIVTRESYKQTVEKLTKSSGYYGLDTETTGLRHHDKLFSIIISDSKESFYFNFNQQEDYEGTKIREECILDRQWLQELVPMFSNPKNYWFIHNAKFDLRMLAKDGLFIAGTVHCTQALERLIKNNLVGKSPYSLSSCAKRYGFGDKLDAVAKCVKDNKLSTTLKLPGRSRKEKLLHYDKVPFDLMAEYGEMDGTLVYKLGMEQIKRIKSMPDCIPLARIERDLTKVCFDMEWDGIQLDMNYVAMAEQYEEIGLEIAYSQFKNLTGIEFKRGPKCLVEAFDKLNVPYSKTEKGNPSFNSDALEDMNHPLGDLLKLIRKREKFISTYYSNFRYLSDSDGILRPSINQGGTQTGRFSYSAPNLQNVPKEDSNELKYYVRKCFVPRPGYCFVMIDYDQQEYRMMVDLAGEHQLIKKIHDGMDVHTATGEMMGVDRRTAKTINFMLLYGGGHEKLAKALGVSNHEAKGLKDRYFRTLPKVERFIKETKIDGQLLGSTTNWMMRRYYLYDKGKAYILPNHVIQGGCADVIKSAMVKISSLLKTENLRSRMLVQVHDELLFEVHESELHLVPKFKEIMESVYQPRSNLRLTCGVDHSWKSWATIDKIKGIPDGKETRDSIQGKDSA